MVKKKVSKKKTHSSSHATKKSKEHATHNVTIVTPKRPAVEKLEMSPIEQSTAAQVQDIPPIVGEPVQQIRNIDVAPTPIFKDDTQEKIIIPEKKADGSLIVKILAIIICSIVVLFWIGLAIMSIEINPGPHIVSRNVSVTTYYYDPISFDRLMNISDVKYSEMLTQKGYLREEKTDKDFIKKYIVDDKGNKIELIMVGISQGNQYDNLFVTNETSRNPYNVTGTFRFEINRYIIEVDNITPETKVMKEASVWRMENLTTDDIKGVTFNIARGVNKIVQFVYVSSNG